MMKLIIGFPVLALLLVGVVGKASSHSSSDDSDTLYSYAVPAPIIGDLTSYFYPAPTHGGGEGGDDPLPPSFSRNYPVPTYTGRLEGPGSSDASQSSSST